MIPIPPEKAARFHKQRRATLRKRMAERNIEALLVTHMVNVRYLSGFTGTSATMFITSGGADFLTDFRYTTQADGEVGDLPITEYKDSVTAIAGIAAKRKIKTLWFEADHLSVSSAEKIGSKLGGADFRKSSGLVEFVRLIKDESEIEVIRFLISLLAKVFDEDLLELIHPGAVERDVAVELEYLLRKSGASGPAFDFIVASGERSAIPHGVASDKVIGMDEMVTLDWGAKGFGYHSDNTRTLAVGTPPPELIKVYEIVLEANTSAIEAVRPGVSLKSVDNVARSIIKRGGYEKAFGHGTGHGVGLDIHEKPTVSWKDETIAKPGMVFTIEPGIYLPGKGGVRIEDMVLVTEDGCELMSAALPKRLITLHG